MRGALLVPGRANRRKVQTKLTASRTATPSGTATARPKRTYACARTAPARNATCRRPNVNHKHRNGARRASRPTRGARIYQPFYETPYPQPSIIEPSSIWASSSPVCHADFADQQCDSRMNPGGSLCQPAPILSRHEGRRRPYGVKMTGKCSDPWYFAPNSVFLLSKQLCQRSGSLRRSAHLAYIF